MISTAYCKYMVRIIEELGLERAKMAPLFSFDIDAKTDAKARIAIDELHRLLTFAASELNDPHLALNMSRRFRISTYSEQSNIFAFCADFETVIDMVKRFDCLVHTLGTTKLIKGTQDGEVTAKTVWTLNYSDTDDVKYQIITELVIANFVASFNWLAWGFGRGVKKVTFQHEHTPPLSAYINTLKCDVEFGAPQTTIVLENGILNTPLPTADVVKFSQKRIQLERILTSYNSERNIVTRTEEKIRDIMQHSNPTLPIVSKALGMSDRTFKRALKHQNSSFRDITNAVKMDMCNGYMKEGVTHTNIAQLLWYADQSGFSRAYKKWHGIPPSQRKPNTLSRNNVVKPRANWRTLEDSNL